MSYAISERCHGGSPVLVDRAPAVIGRPQRGGAADGVAYRMTAEVAGAAFVVGAATVGLGPADRNSGSLKPDAEIGCLVNTLPAAPARMMVDLERVERLRRAGRTGSRFDHAEPRGVGINRFGMAFPVAPPQEFTV